MSAFLENLGGLIGGMVEGGAGLVTGTVTKGADRAFAGAVMGGSVGAVAGVVTGPGEIVTIPGGALIGGLTAGATAGVPDMVRGAQQGVQDGRAIVRGWEDYIAEMSAASERRSGRRALVRDLTTACATCGCARLAAGRGGAPYRGGAHIFMQRPNTAPTQSHHMVADIVSPLGRSLAPAIQMDTLDHRRTTSFGSNRYSPYNQVVGAIANHISATAAFNIEAANIRRLFPGKYDDAIAQAREYAECLRRSGLMT